MTKYISKETTKTLTKGKQYQILKKTKQTISILNDEKKIEDFQKQDLKKYFDV